MINWLHKLPAKAAVKYFLKEFDKEMCINNRRHCVDADLSVPQEKPMHHLNPISTEQ